MLILGIETSCDETALAIIEANGEIPHVQVRLVGETLLSQIEIHKKYGGVFPALAKREHGKNLIPSLKKLLAECGLLSGAKKTTLDEKLKNKIIKIFEREGELYGKFLDFIPKITRPPIDAIAVTYGPGLEPALWVGINFAYALKEVWGIPVMPINHMEGHIFSTLLPNETDGEIKLKNIDFPAIALLISGGHSELVLVKDWVDFEIIGQTRDDAVGEAFDKVARIMGLPYPGGPEISNLADTARKREKKTYEVKLPRPMIKSGDLDFSFSGLKTAFLYTYRKIKEPTPEIKQEFAREFEDAATDVLVSKTKTAIERYNARSLIVGGGVIANKRIRGALENLSKNSSAKTFLMPKISLSTDNAVMISIAGYIHALTNAHMPELSEIKARGNLRLSKIHAMRKPK